MARGRSTDDLTTLQMALVGYQVERQKIEEKISELQAKLKGKHVGVSSPAAGGGTRSKRVLSPPAPARIAAPHRKTRAEHPQEKTAPTQPARKGEEHNTLPKS